ncbi:hybrid sensor histidine kinase/response regulator [Arenimonas oryziterrae]|uniref:hybrid sensor histidine kinase/response regulator n=1 Tax=Arenimonas oryziterrae TaxID=498055 RepID=UPI00138AEB87|nr:hybrid sensor histidine kinase/response regulator [Arenimonas oryziterrae]
MADKPGVGAPLPVVLVIDDQDANVRLVGQLLSRANYEVVPAMSGREGLELAVASAPDLVLLDMRMPGMTGFEVLEQLRDNPATRDIPVVFLTADNERDSLTRAFAAGAVDYITKPFVSEELLARVRTHLELKQSRDRLARVADERQQVADIVSHDLRNYFANVLFAADMLRDPDLPVETRLRLAESIRTSADSGVLFLQAFLDQQGQQAQGTAVQPLRAGELFEHIIELLQRQAQVKQIMLRIAPASEDIRVCGHRAGTIHVLQNMVSNALKYSPAGSEVSLQATHRGPHGRLSVLDRGPGISPRDRERLFQRYVRLSPQPTQGESSTGLGLALAKQRARTMGGDLWYDDRDGGGSMFTLELPLA